MINNLKKLLTEEQLEKFYYICSQEKAKELFLAGFNPICTDDNHYYIFYKTNSLLNFLKESKKEDEMDE